MFDWFDELDSSRQWVDGIPLAITWGEKLAWQTVTGNIVSGAEWSVLAKMDTAFRVAMAAERPKLPEPETK